MEFKDPCSSSIALIGDRYTQESGGVFRDRRSDTTNPAGKAMFQMLGVFAEFERSMIQERVRAGLARAKSEGKRPGRPRIAPEPEERIRKALATPGRPGVRKIAERFGVDPGTVQRISRPFEQDAVAL
jgi:DNA invertase Pin-like site-specific DNA recombinase